MKLLLSQPRLRREWELRRGDKAVATLRTSLFRRGAEVEIGDERHVLKSQRVLELGGRRAEWSRSAGTSATASVAATGGG
jgi:hypothetical protein